MKINNQFQLKENLQQTPKDFYLIQYHWLTNQTINLK